jgi:hypothetical protein
VFDACPVTMQAQVLYQLDYRPASSSTPWSSSLSQQQLIEVTDLQPGTKYVFHARGGYAAADAVQRAAAASAAAGDDAAAAVAAAAAEGVTWGDFSVESSYATSGVCVWLENYHQFCVTDILKKKQLEWCCSFQFAACVMMRR